MSTGVIIVLIVIVIAAAVLAGAAALSPRARSALGGGSLQHRFGPEYERTVARHDGDTKAAERELTERLKRYGSLRDQPLEPSERERYTALWTAAQERFVDSPGRRWPRRTGCSPRWRAPGATPPATVATNSSTRCPCTTPRCPGLPPAAPRRSGLRHRLQSGAGTEELRETLLEARALFEELTAPARRQPARAPAQKAPESASAVPRGGPTTRGGSTGSTRRGVEGDDRGDTE